MIREGGEIQRESKREIRQGKIKEGRQEIKEGKRKWGNKGR